MKQTFTLELITPARAEKMLKQNKVNRPISSGTVVAYANDIKAGRWDTDTTACIAFDKNGGMVDGQHRLKAIILANVPVLMWICRGVGDKVVFDSGRTRTLSDYMKINHSELESIYHSTRTLSVIRYLIVKIDNRSNHRVSQHELEEFVFEHKKDFDDFFSVINPSLTAPKISITVVLVSMYMAYMSGVSLDDLSHFYRVLRDGMSESSNDYPIIAYRNYLLGLNTTASQTEEEIKRCQGAIKKYLTGSGLRRVYNPKELIWDFPYMKGA